VFSRTDIPVTPSHWVGALSALPWLGLALFNLVLTFSFGGSFLLLFALSLAGVFYQWNLNGRLCLARSITRLVLTESGMIVEQANGKQVPVAVDPESRLYHRLIILKLRPTNSTNRRSTVLLWAINQRMGNIPGDLHRQLRVWLNLGPAGAEQHQTE